jgi:uncharacterized protein with HEPN domain
MTRPDVRKYLHDILSACQLIRRFTAGKSLGDYQSDDLLRSAVERQFEIAGEALGAALRSDPGMESNLSNARRIIAFRNRLIHGYASISNEVVWGIIESHLPVLLQEVQGLLESRER